MKERRNSTIAQSYHHLDVLYSTASVQHDRRSTHRCCQVATVHEQAVAWSSDTVVISCMVHCWLQCAVQVDGEEVQHHVDVGDVTTTADESTNVETTMRVLKIRLW